MVESVAEELSNEDLIELDAQKVAEEEERQNVEEEPAPPKKFSVKHMAEAFATINKGMQMFDGMDQNYERYAKVDRIFQDALACYREIYNEKKKKTVQSKLDTYFKKSPSAVSSRPTSAASSLPQDDPIPSTSKFPQHINLSEESNIDDPPSPLSSSASSN